MTAENLRFNTETRDTRVDTQTAAVMLRSRAATIFLLSNVRMSQCHLLVLQMLREDWDFIQITVYVSVSFDSSFLNCNYRLVIMFYDPDSVHSAHFKLALKHNI